MGKTQPDLVHQLTPPALASTWPRESCALGTGQAWLSEARAGPQASAGDRSNVTRWSSALRLFSCCWCCGHLRPRPARSPGNTGLHCWLHRCTDLWCFAAKKVMLKDRLAFESETHPKQDELPYVARSSSFGNNLHCQRERPFLTSRISSPQKNPGDDTVQVWPSPIASLRQ